MFEKAIFLDYASIHPDDLDIGRLESVVESWCWHDRIHVENIEQAIVDADVIVTNKVILDASHFKSAKKLKLVCAAATGVNNIDISEARHFGIDVCNVTKYATTSVVQHVFSMLLSLITNLSPYQQVACDGSWTKSDFFCVLDFPVRELSGLTLGIVGYGELGQAVANVAKAFGMKVLLVKRNADDSRKERLALHDLLPQVDVLSLHCPLTDENRHLIAEKELALMKSDALLINTARGGLIDESALLTALKAKRLGGAALDVLAQEPPPADYPLLKYKAENLVLTPHCAWASREARQRLVNEIAENIRVFASGGQRNLVNG